MSNQTEIILALAADNERLRAARAHIGKVYACTCGPEWTSYGGNHHDPNCKAEVLAEFDAALDPVTKPAPVPASGNEGTHGVDCKKAPHSGVGYLHGADDDSPYDVDGVTYCGRCHYAIDTTPETDAHRSFSGTRSELLVERGFARNLERQRNAALRDRDELKRRVEGLQVENSRLGFAANDNLDKVMLSAEVEQLKAEIVRKDTALEAALHRLEWAIRFLESDGDIEKLPWYDAKEWLKVAREHYAFGVSALSPTAPKEDGPRRR